MELKRLCEPYQTYDDVIVGLIREGNRNRLYDETDRIIKGAHLRRFTMNY